MDNFAGSPQKPPKHILSLEEAEKLFEPYKQLLSEAIQEGWDEWERFYKPKHHVLRPRARASIVYDEIVHSVAQKFAGLPGVEFKPHRSSFLLYIGDRIIVRFKKFGKNGRCSNIRTRQQFLFAMQVQLPGMEKGTMFNAGYVLNDLQNTVQRKAIVCTFGDSVLYSIDLVGEAAPVIVFEPTPSTPSPEAERTERFEPRPEAQPETETEKGKKKKRKGA